jgi:hypothetical protein
MFEQFAGEDEADKAKDERWRRLLLSALFVFSEMKCLLHSRDCLVFLPLPEWNGCTDVMHAYPSPGEPSEWFCMHAHRWYP